MEMDETRAPRFWPTCRSRLHLLSPGSPSRWACSMILRGTQGSGLNNESNMSLTLKAAKNGLLKQNGMGSNKVKEMMDKYNKCLKERRGGEGIKCIVGFVFIIYQLCLKLNY